VNWKLRAIRPATLALVVLTITNNRRVGQTAPGVTSNQILIGSCSALEGPSHALGTERIKGAEAYFDVINHEGGVAGRKLKLLAYDDSYDPTKTETCCKRLQSQNVFALGFFVGTPTALKYLPMAEEVKIPVVGLFTGAPTLYAPLRHWGNQRARFVCD
jgi:ABC-type branched-subunit amino acid transport system substrate-binding protein